MRAVLRKAGCSIEPRQHARGIAKGRMLADVANALTINPHFSSVVETVEELLAGVGKECCAQGPPGAGAGVVSGRYNAVLHCCTQLTRPSEPGGGTHLRTSHLQPLLAGSDCRI